VRGAFRGAVIRRHASPPNVQKEAIMMMRITLIAAAASALVIAGCSSRTHTREIVHTAPQQTPTTIVQPMVVQPAVVVDTAPPAPQTETMPAPPYSGAVWIPGHWSWSNGQYQWVPGRYERQREGYVWVPQRWEQVNGKWQSTGGVWMRQ
jgi:hypothetical protein